MSEAIAHNMIRVILNNPRAASELPDVGLLFEILRFMKQRPEASTAAILGAFQNKEGGEVLFKLAAREFLLPNDPTQIDQRSAELAEVEAELDKIIADGVQDKERFKELLYRQRALRDDGGFNDNDKN